MGNVLSKSESETFELARELAEGLAMPAHILLYGELGAGKTTFTKGLAAGLGLEDINDVSSPTFTLINEYAGSVPIYHVDLYRIEGVELHSLGLEDMFDKPAAAVIVEWADRLTDFHGDSVVSVYLKYVDAYTREIEIQCKANGIVQNKEEK